MEIMIDLEESNTVIKAILWAQKVFYFFDSQPTSINLKLTAQHEVIRFYSMSEFVSFINGFKACAKMHDISIPNTD